MDSSLIYEPDDEINERIIESKIKNKETLDFISAYHYDDNYLSCKRNVGSYIYFDYGAQGTKQHKPAGGWPSDYGRGSSGARRRI